ncbi:lanC-like protein 2 isoform X1 [Varroa jacobsoni]|uniref:LanC-like protein 2 n=1 Tax=Varroa destructor TaxID=109461 RepID=A0A7M7K8C4_VARDE|nr:lanC-like protein 2 [Varroa destructor]XP_022687645.1 lanC-like protein 2 isoform X1 [Varroa jacobsoni]
MSERYFKNPYEDYEEYIEKHRAFYLDKFIPEIECTVYKLLKVLELEVPIKTDSRDYSVYTGSTGIALLYMKLADAQPEKRDQLLEKAREILVTQRLAKKRHDFTFLCGDVGPIATRAVLHHRMGYSKEVKADIDLLHKFATGCLSLETGEPDELLYGRVGYLYSLLFIETHIAAHSIDAKLIKSVVQAVIESGEVMASQMKIPTPLMYKWHDSYYLGAAHGLAGITYMLLEAKQYLSAEEMSKVKATIDYLITIRYSSGNYPSSLGSTSDRLVHWCHGAAGFIHLFAKAYEIFGEELYLKEAKSCSEVIWKRGLLKKGYGLCHGVAGNAYAFLRVYRLTSEQKYLYQACRFAEFCCAYGTHGCRIADRPYSLFEGMAGTIFFLVDMLSPTQARFPAFEL